MCVFLFLTLPVFLLVCSFRDHTSPLLVFCRSQMSESTETVFLKVHVWDQRTFTFRLQKTQLLKELLPRVEKRMLLKQALQAEHLKLCPKTQDATTWETAAQTELSWDSSVGDVNLDGDVPELVLISNLPEHQTPKPKQDRARAAAASSASSSAAHNSESVCSMCLLGGNDDEKSRVGPKHKCLGCQKIFCAKHASTKCFLPGSGETRILKCCDQCSKTKGVPVKDSPNCARYSSS